MGLHAVEARGVTVTPPPAPPGFECERHGRGLLYARPELIDSLREIGLTRTRRWTELLDRSVAGGPGRGRTARIELPAGPRVVLKKLRRGGLTATLWRDRFPGHRRLMANLIVPGVAAERGIPTPPAVALLLRSSVAGLAEGWLMTEELGGTRDLQTILEAGAPPRGTLEATLGLVRHMHDSGLDHLDLNLGNLLVRPADHDRPHAFVVDLDRARLAPGPLAYRLRLRALRRLERSYFKRFGTEGPLGPDPAVEWYGIYAGQDAALARRLAASRPFGRLWLGIHRLGWRF